jgi:hypothetical protein|nr:MAG TPA: AAA domain protein [Caudoviricetes sp.]
MLLSFSVENFRSIRERITLDMRKDKINEHGKTLINNAVLPLAVIYGPNGGGKSNVLLAFLTLYSFIINKAYSVYYAGPFLLDNESCKKPTIFETIMAIEKEEYRHYLEIDFQADKVIYEELYVKRPNRKTTTKLFVRENNEIIFGDDLKRYIGMANNVSEKISMLTFMNQFYRDPIVNRVYNWYYTVICMAFNQEQLERFWGIMAAINEDALYKSFMKKLLKEMDLAVDDYELERLNNQQVKIKTNHSIKGEVYQFVIQQESMGTQKIFALLPAITTSLISGTPFVVDELDAKLHPKLLRYIIELYKSKEYNPKGAQLIFTSHDLTTMNNEVFRRDEIWFAAKDENQSTKLYSLSDIRDEDGKRLRHDAVYSKQYLEGRYGADPYFKAMSEWES